MYLSKETIIKAYDVLSKATPKNLNNFSAIQYFLATDRFDKNSNGNPCDSSVTQNKTEFYKYIEDVIALDDGNYLSSFKILYEGTKSIASTVSSNFFSGSSVEHSNNTPDRKFDYPKNSALIYALNGKVYKEDTYYQNIKDYLTTEEERVALAIWLLRKSDAFNSLSIEEIKESLEVLYSALMVNTLLPIDDEKWNSYKESLNVECKDEIAYISKEDIVGQTYKPTKHIENMSVMDEKQLRYITALRAKPFLLLAGISGTGKSQKVLELAYMTCPKGELREEGAITPGNYCLIEVKPNWHDSTELLGYYSALTGRYELTDFIRFVYKAIQNENVPFFLCLDEMNLAPVEQYFAEFLSVLETRKKVGEHIVSEPLLPKMRFNNCKLQEYIHTEGEGVVVIDGENYNMKDLYQKEDREVMEYLMKNGLGLPDNLFVIGTVNMDDTTHQFSRKVIDRAFTIEMNGGKLSDMFTPESKMLLEYRDEPLPLDAFKSIFVRAHEVLEHPQYAKYVPEITKQIPELLGDSDGTAKPDSINGVLNNTPFRVSYRVQNELVLYLSVLIERANFPEPDNISDLIVEATLAILLEKVLPRIQGEQKQLETKGGSSNVLKDLKAFVEGHLKLAEGSEDNPIYKEVVRKLEEMNDKLTNYYTYFF